MDVFSSVVVFSTELAVSTEGQELARSSLVSSSPRCVRSPAGSGPDPVGAVTWRERTMAKATRSGEAAPSLQGTALGVLTVSPARQEPGLPQSSETPALPGRCALLLPSSSPRPPARPYLEFQTHLRGRSLGCFSLTGVHCYVVLVKPVASQNRC